MYGATALIAIYHWIWCNMRNINLLIVAKYIIYIIHFAAALLLERRDY